MSFLIGKAHSGDVKTLAPLFDAYRVFYEKESNLSLAEQFLKERLENDESVIFLVKTEEGECAGFVQLYPVFSSLSAQRSWILNDLYVVEKHRGSGAARLLMEAAKEYARKTGANGIALETAPDNAPARALYESLGYQEEKGFLHYFLSLD